MSTSDADSATKSRSPLSLPVVSLIEYSCVLLFEANDSALDNKAFSRSALSGASLNSIAFNNDRFSLFVVEAV